MNLELTTTPSIPGSKGQHAVLFGLNCRLATSVAPKHFAAKEFIKLKFNVPEPTDKKRKIDPSVLNEENVDVPYGAKFEHCVFNNSTLNFLPKPC